MLLRKQTVWLLTMLSLVAVLSVYYVTSPQDSSMNQATEKTKEKESPTKETTDGSKVSVETNGASDSVFDAMRIDLNDARSKEKEALTNKVASSELSEEERIEAHQRIETLSELSAKEDMLETMIVAEMGYKDALVRAVDNRILITVKSKKPSASEANKIIQMVTKEIGKTNAVAVEFQPEK